MNNTVNSTTSGDCFVIYPFRHCHHHSYHNNHSDDDDDDDDLLIKSENNWEVLYHHHHHHQDDSISNSSNIISHTSHINNTSEDRTSFDNFQQNDITPVMSNSDASASVVELYLGIVPVLEPTAPASALEPSVAAPIPVLEPAAVSIPAVAPALIPAAAAAVPLPAVAPVPLPALIPVAPAAVLIPAAAIPQPSVVPALIPTAATVPLPALIPAAAAVPIPVLESNLSYYIPRFGHTLTYIDNQTYFVTGGVSFDNETGISLLFDLSVGDTNNVYIAAIRTANILNSDSSMHHDYDNSSSNSRSSNNNGSSNNINSSKNEYIPFTHEFMTVHHNLPCGGCRVHHTTSFSPALTHATGDDSSPVNVSKVYLLGGGAQCLAFGPHFCQSVGLIVQCGSYLLQQQQLDSSNINNNNNNRNFMITNNSSNSDNSNNNNNNPINNNNNNNNNHINNNNNTTTQNVSSDEKEEEPVLFVTVAKAKSIKVWLETESEAGSSHRHHSSGNQTASSNNSSSHNNNHSSISSSSSSSSSSWRSSSSSSNSSSSSSSTYIDKTRRIAPAEKGAYERSTVLYSCGSSNSNNNSTSNTATTADSMTNINTNNNSVATDDDIITNNNNDNSNDEKEKEVEKEVEKELEEYKQYVAIPISMTFYNMMMMMMMSSMNAKDPSSSSSSNAWRLYEKLITHYTQSSSSLPSSSSSSSSLPSSSSIRLGYQNVKPNKVSETSSHKKASKYLYTYQNQHKLANNAKDSYPNKYELIGDVLMIPEHSFTSSAWKWLIDCSDKSSSSSSSSSSSYGNSDNNNQNNNNTHVSTNQHSSSSSSSSSSTSSSSSLPLQLSDQQLHQRQDFWQGLASCFSAQAVTRIARKARIHSGPKRESQVEILWSSLSTTYLPSSSSSSAPSYLPSSTTSSSSSLLDFNAHSTAAATTNMIPQQRPVTGVGSAGWVTVIENGILFSFDITRVMFCSGNCTERMRMGTKDMVKDEVIVDMYAGVGYYTLPFLIDGQAKHVHACEWNVNSLLAITQNFQQNHIHPNRYTLYPGDNEVTVLNPTNALKDCANRICLGLLPTSEKSWKLATYVAKRNIPIYIHVHENVLDSHIDNWCEETKQKFELLFLMDDKPMKIEMKWLEKVKSYAPHIIHVVLDLYCIPIVVTDYNNTINNSGSSSSSNNNNN